MGDLTTRGEILSILVKRFIETNEKDLDNLGGFISEHVNFNVEIKYSDYQNFIELSIKYQTCTNEDKTLNVSIVKKLIVGSIKEEYV